MIRSLVGSVIHDARVTHAAGVSLQVDACLLQTADPQNRVLSAT